MLTKFLTITLFLLSATTFAEFNDQNPSKWPEIDSEFKEVLFEHLNADSLDPVSLETTSSEKTEAFEAAVKVLSYTEGFFNGIDKLDIFADTIECLEASMKFVEDLENGVKDLASQDPSKVNDAIITLGHVTDVILDAVSECRPAGVDIQALTKLVGTFKSPYSFIFNQGRSLLINHVEIIFEVAHISEAYNSRDYIDLGYWVGKAMDSIVKDLNKKLRPEYAEFLNNVNQWKAGIPKKFENMTFEEIKNRFLGSQPLDYSSLGNLTEFNYEGSIQDVPTYFNCSEQWPSCVHPIRDQGQCGSCWAFAASEVLSDRFCVASNGSVQVVLSPQYLLSCDKPLSLGCDGGVPLFSWWFIIKDGLVTDECLPYLSYNGTNPLKCDDFKTCQDGSQPAKYYGVNESAVVLHNPPSIQANMMEYGPVDAAMIVYEDFMYYTGGVYKHSTGKMVGLHSVKLTGWGTENGENYWIVANSWGATWGENGYFRIAFGQCGIDSATATGRADLTRLPTTTQNRFW